jgi:hypothetical protein
MNERRNVAVLGSYGESLVDFRGSSRRDLAQRGHHVVACAGAALAAMVEVLASMGMGWPLPVGQRI